MKEQEVFKLTSGMRVVHVPTGEIGTVVRIAIRVAIRVERQDGPTSSSRYALQAVIVKLDQPAWLPPITYHLRSVPGRKIIDLQPV